MSGDVAFEEMAPELDELEVDETFGEFALEGPDEDEDWDEEEFEDDENWEDEDWEDEDYEDDEDYGDDEEE